MTENERVRSIRKSKKINMTLEKFGQRLGVTKSAISDIERGRNNLTDQMRILICHEFHVNESWLRTGEGEMFEQRNKKEEIASFLTGMPESSFKERFISVLARLDESDWEIIERIISDMVGIRKEGNGEQLMSMPDPKETTNEGTEILSPEDMEDVKRRTAEFERRLIEEKKVEAGSSRSNQQPA